MATLNYSPQTHVPWGTGGVDGWCLCSMVVRKGGSWLIFELFYFRLIGWLASLHQTLFPDYQQQLVRPATSCTIFARTIVLTQLRIKYTNLSVRLKQDFCMNIYINISTWNLRRLLLEPVDDQQHTVLACLLAQDWKTWGFGGEWRMRWNIICWPVLDVYIEIVATLFSWFRVAQHRLLQVLLLSCSRGGQGELILGLSWVWNISDFLSYSWLAWSYHCQAQCLCLGPLGVTEQDMINKLNITGIRAHLVKEKVVGAVGEEWAWLLYI